MPTPAGPRTSDGKAMRAMSTERGRPLACAAARPWLVGILALPLLLAVVGCDSEPEPPGEPAALVKMSGDLQEGLPGYPLLDPPTVRVVDDAGRPVPGVAVAWMPRDGSRTVSLGADQTAADGTIGVEWTLGTDRSRPQILAASSTGLTDIEFLATFGYRTRWESVASLPLAVRSPAAAADGNRLFVFGGNLGPDTRTDVTQIYDPATGTWTQGARLPKALDFLHAVALDDGIHVFGGIQTGVGTVADHWVYQPSSDSWTARTPLLVQVDAAMVAAVDGQIVVAGGVTGPRQYSDRVQIYDPASDAWLTGAPIPGAPRLSSAFVERDGLLHLLGGGVPSLDTTNEHIAYDLTTDTWRAFAQLPGAVEAHAAGNVAGHICYFGGRLAQSGRFNSPRAETWCATPNFETWVPGPPMGAARAEVVSATLGGAVYAIGGHDDTGASLSLVQRLVATPLAALDPTVSAEPN